MTKKFIVRFVFEDCHSSMAWQMKLPLVQLQQALRPAALVVVIWQKARLKGYHQFSLNLITYALHIKCSTICCFILFTLEGFSADETTGNISISTSAIFPAIISIAIMLLWRNRNFLQICSFSLQIRPLLLRSSAVNNRPVQLLFLNNFGPPQAIAINDS